jgi:hypothetical protein
MSLLVAPALIVAPYERLQTYARRRNQQADYLHYRDARRAFDAAMGARFSNAPFWTDATRPSVGDWQGSRVPLVLRDPGAWKTTDGASPNQEAFWNVDVGRLETKQLWKWLRDALSHWNVATADREYARFDEGGVMQRLIFYRANSDNGPWDVLSVSPEAFVTFLEAWAAYLSRGLARQVLAGRQAA